MRAEEVAYLTLSSYPDVIELVDSRVYPDFVPTQRDVPAIAITRGETDYVATIHNGAPVAAHVTIEVWCVGASRQESEIVADAAMLALTLGSPGEFYPADRKPESQAGPPERFATVLSMLYWEL